MPAIAGCEVTIPQVRGTIAILSYYRRFINDKRYSDSARCVNPEDWAGLHYTKAQAAVRLGFLVNTAINRKAGIPDPEQDIELWRDCQLVQHLVHRNNPSGLQWRWCGMSGFRTRRIQKRYGHLMRGDFD